MPNEEHRKEDYAGRNTIQVSTLSDRTAKAQFSEPERCAISDHVDRLTEPLWENHLRGSVEEVARAYGLRRPSNESELRAAIADLQRPLPFKAIGARATLDARQALAGRFSAGCVGSLVSAPYELGIPENERTGEDATAPGSQTFTSFSSLADTNIGAVSAAAAIGKVQIFGSQYSYPSSWFYSFSNGMGDGNQAEAKLVKFVELPGGRQREADVEVTVDVEIGNDGDPFYLLLHSLDSRAVASQVVGEAFLTVGGSGSGASVESEKTFFRFLRAYKLSGEAHRVPLSEDLFRAFSISSRIHLPSRISWLFVSLQIRVAAMRLFNVEELPVDEREGFAAFDLRSSSEPQTPVTPFLQPGGAVSAPFISISYCSPQEFARR